MRTPLNIHYIIVSLVVLLLTACDVHEFPGGMMPPDTTHPCSLMLHFNDRDMPLLTTVEYDAAGRGRARADEEHDARFIINVYNADDEMAREPLHTMTVTDRAVTATDDRTVDMRLMPGRYRVLVWTDYVDKGTFVDKYHVTDDFSEISLRSVTGRDDTPYRHQGNTLFRDAFRGEAFVAVGEEGVLRDVDGNVAEVPLPVEMYRPLARFHFITTDLNEFVSRYQVVKDGNPAEVSDDAVHVPSPDPDDYRVVMRYASYMPSTYNAHTDKPVDSRLGVYFEGEISRIDEHNAALGSDFVFVNGSQTSVQVALDVYSRADNELIASTGPITVPLKRNHLTIVKGRFLTTKSGTGMGINPGYNGDHNIEIM